MKLVIVNTPIDRYYEFIWNALGEKAQERLTSLFTDGFFKSSKNHPVRSIGIILSKELQLQLKITSPPKKDGIIGCVYVEVCMFDSEQMKTGAYGKYVHFGK